MSNSITRLLSTFFYIGYFPAAPGTLASVAGVFLCFLFRDQPILYILVFLIVTVIGFAVSGKMEGLTDEKDPSCIVIDEVSGVMIAFFMLPFTLPVVMTAFFLFRAFDMFKIYPVNKFESLHGGKGVMLDDLFAGLYTNITMHVAIRLAGINVF